MNSKKIACLLELSSKIDLQDLHSVKTNQHKTYVATMLKNIEDLGFTFSKKLINRMAEVSMDGLIVLYKEIVPVLKRMKGANVRHKPMYPNFPEQVMESSDAELYINAIIHYASVALGGNILPETEKKERFPLIGNYLLKVIDIADKNDYEEAITDLMTSNIALSDSYKKYIEDYYTANRDTFEVPEIKNKEILAFVAGILYADKNLKNLSALMKTPTDVLRFITALSDGDVSLAENTKFKKMKRSERRMILKLLNGMKSLPENMVKYASKWLRLGEILHPGEKAKQMPKVYAAFSALRKGEHIETFNSKVEALINEGKHTDCAKLLVERPGDFARRLDALLRKSTKKDGILKSFKSIADKVSTNVLLNIRSHFGARNNGAETRMFFPKGNMARTQVIPNTLKPLSRDVCEEVRMIVANTLIKRFAKEEDLGKVFIDDSLKTINVPFALRSASHSFKTIARGSRVAVAGDKNVIRLFTYWKNGLKAGEKQNEDIGYYDGNRIDIDLSVMFLNDKFEDAGHVSWTNLRDRDGSGNETLSVHSGDITDAPNGASEFIDINIPVAIKNGYRYAAVNIYCFTGQTFNQMNECFAGVMLRDDMKSGEIYDAKTVEHKYDLTSVGIASVPLLFDLVKKEIVWLDLAMKDRYAGWGRTIEGHKKSMSVIVKGIVELSKPTMYDLLTLHAKGRGVIVKDPKKADKVFDLKYATDSVPEILTMI